MFGKIWVEDYNWESSSIWMLFKAMRLKEITKGANINRKEKMCKDWTLALSVDLKKIHNMRVMNYWGQNSFIWGQNENCSPGESTSKKLLQRCRGKGQDTCDFEEGRVYAIKHTFSQKVASSLVKLSAGHEKQSSPWRTLALFYRWGDTRIGDIKFYIQLSEDLTCQFPPPHQHKVPHFSTLNSFQGVLKVSNYSSTRLNPCRGRRQALMASAYVWPTLRTGAHFTSSWDFCLILALLLKTLSQWASTISVSHFPILGKQGLKKQQHINYPVLKKIWEMLVQGSKTL